MIKNKTGLYLKTTIYLTFLTIIELGISYWEIPRFSQIGFLISLSLAKMVTVIYVYMHLYYENTIIKKILFIPIPLMLYFFLGLVYEAKFEWFIK